MSRMRLVVAVVAGQLLEVAHAMATGDYWREPSFADRRADENASHYDPPFWD